MNSVNKIKIGDFNRLTVVKVVDFGLYLEGGHWGDILLPSRYVAADSQVGDMLNVFIYFDSEDRIIATTETPKAKVGEFAYLQAVDVNDVGAFLDWGLAKDILVPYAEQANKMRQGVYYIVHIYQDDESERLTASSRISHFINQNPAEYQLNEAVNLMIVSETDLGYKAIINHAHWGMLYHNEVFTLLKTGQQIVGRIKKNRADGKIDLRLEQPDKGELSALEQHILDKLATHYGQLSIGDKTPPDVIYQSFAVSKKNFKRAISRLYKKRLIRVESEHIYLTK